MTLQRLADTSHFLFVKEAAESIHSKQTNAEFHILTSVEIPSIMAEIMINTAEAEQNLNVMYDNSESNVTISFDLTPIFGDSKWAITALVLTTICHMVISPLFYGILWYEVNSHIRTLINQLLAMACWSSLLYSTWTLVFTYARFLLGPMNDLMCGIDIIVMNTVGICEMIFMDCIVIAKYVFVHLMKNPVALDDELFKYFIGLASGLLSFLSQVVFVVLPGRNPLRFNVCTGKIPVRYITEKVPVKFNLPFYLMLLVSCIILAGIFVLRKLNKKKNLTEPPTVATHKERNLLNQSSLLLKTIFNV